MSAQSVGLRKLRDSGRKSGQGYNTCKGKFDRGKNLLINMNRGPLLRWQTARSTTLDVFKCHVTQVAHVRLQNCRRAQTTSPGYKTSTSHP
jgi:hypothetical protein